ncbi:GlcG/HbpS family heme-binding protein [Colwellia psychrerythraea]|uniref:Heme-binding protein n=1 Tax=Colwellia psychrerythraea TaxID=28229 RepID=A0A099KDB3_COLPS|nr:heme-binding protein [Colwellia psychrerythraea]KGJ88315.1 protein of unknown function DUF336 [Colwellia psychrerythraea]
MKKSNLKTILALSALCTGLLLSSTYASAKSDKNCTGLPDHLALKTALDAAVMSETSGLDFDMWATVVNRDGVVCAVAFSGQDRGSQWPGSRVISAQKSNTANAFSLDGLSLSTANLFSAIQPGGSLYGLNSSNPVNTKIAYKGPSKKYGMPNDPMVGKKVGGVNTFGGGLGLYNADYKIIGGLGVSGDTSCADHMIAWRTRANLTLDYLSTVGGVNSDTERPDNIIYDVTPNPSGGTGTSAGGFGHSTCLNTGDQTLLPAVR